MGKNPLNQGVVTENFIGIGAVSREMIEARARELEEARQESKLPPHPDVSRAAALLCRIGEEVAVAARAISARLGFIEP